MPKEKRYPQEIEDNINQAEDEDTARIMADAEKHFRDTARDADLKISLEEKQAFDTVAEKIGDRIMKNLTIEKLNRLERLQIAQAELAEELDQEASNGSNATNSTRYGILRDTLKDAIVSFNSAKESLANSSDSEFNNRMKIFEKQVEAMKNFKNNLVNGL